MGGGIPQQLACLPLMHEGQIPKLQKVNKQRNKILIFYIVKYMPTLLFNLQVKVSFDLNTIQIKYLDEEDEEVKYFMDPTAGHSK